jgi:hypothetical protein
MYRVSDTNIIAENELALARAQMAPEEYEQEFECSFQAAILGSYYGTLMAQAEGEGGILRVPADPAIRVHTAWDLGIGDSTAIWFFQLVGREIRVIDYYESSGVGLDHYAKVLQAKPYVFGEHILPHDAGNNQLATGTSLENTLRSLGIGASVLPRADLEDGINAVRMLLPKCWFDAEKCERGPEALRQYRRDWDEKRQNFRDKPLHDWCSHAADAFRHLAEGHRILLARLNLAWSAQEAPLSKCYGCVMKPNRFRYGSLSRGIPQCHHCADDAVDRTSARGSSQLRPYVRREGPRGRQEEVRVNREILS